MTNPAGKVAPAHSGKCECRFGMPVLLRLIF